MENQNLEEKTHPHRRVSFGIKISFSPSSTKPNLSFILRPQCAYDVAPGGLLASVYQLTRLDYGIYQHE